MSFPHGGAGEWWDPTDRQRWATQRRMVRAPHPEEGEQPDAEQGILPAARLHDPDIHKVFV